MLAFAPLEVDAGMAFKLRFHLDKKTEKADGEHSVSGDTDVVQEAICQNPRMWYKCTLRITPTFPPVRAPKPRKITGVTFRASWEASPSKVTDWRSVPGWGRGSE